MRNPLLLMRNNLHGMTNDLHSRQGLLQNMAAGQTILTRKQVMRGFFATEGTEK